MFHRWMQCCARPIFLALLLTTSVERSLAQENPPGTGDNSPPAFVLEIEAPDDVRALLETHLQLRRFADQTDLTPGEIDRLIALARRNSQDLLATQGYFSPELSLQRDEQGAEGAPPRLILRVQPGVPARVTDVQIKFEGPIADDPLDRAQREAIQREWSLRMGDRFTQSGWERAKQQALRKLVTRRYATGSIVQSLADIDPETHQARLSLTVQSGPPFRIGELIVRGSDRYDAAVAARLSQLVTGESYDQQLLLDAQKKLGESGYFDSVYLTLDTTADPHAAPVLVQVREAKSQKLILGLGANTDVGARFTVEHTHHQLPWLDWRAVSKLNLDQKNQFLSTDLLAPPDARNWRWLAAGKIERDDQPSYVVNSLQLRAGRSQSTDRLDRAYFLLYENAHNDGFDAPPAASALSANTSWTWRFFEGLPFPTGGHGIALEAGVGTTLGVDRSPFARGLARWQGYIPLGRTENGLPGTSRAGRISARAEVGAVVANANANLPTTQLFLTGGDNTVRGYAYESIGVISSTGQTNGGRYLAVGSLEWQRPIYINGRRSDWESAVFIDAGSVSDTPAGLRADIGAGAGVIWNSPVGPLKADLAWGFATSKLRLVLSVGFKF